MEKNNTKSDISVKVILIKNEEKATKTMIQGFFNPLFKDLQDKQVQEETQMSIAQRIGA